VSDHVCFPPERFQMIERIKTYLLETRSELKKVTWPTRQELKDSTRVVIVGASILTVFTGLVDQVLSRVVKLIFG